MKTIKYKSMYLNSILIALTTIISSCRDIDPIEENNATGETEATIDRSALPDWTTLTHSDSVSPDYSTVFNQNEVLRIDIVIDHKDWDDMQDDISSNISLGGRPGSISEFDPIWVPCSFFFDDKEWYEVGIRYKGNSSLNSTVQMGISKLSFKVDFDEYEDDYPEITNQRFYGFKQLNLKNNYQDNSQMREKVASDLFYDFGVPSPQTSFCEVYVDFGEGSTYFGLYTIVEEVDDSMIKTQFGTDFGNIYKPDGDAASFANNTYDESEYEKKNNEDIDDYSDVASLYDVINDGSRTNNEEQWKTDLNAIFDIGAFLKWLAANTALQNWDTYGNMTHNYYLYNDPANGLLTWIPWDNNEALQYGKNPGALSLSLSEVSSSWPLISYITDIPEYKTIYENYLSEFVTEVFTVERMTTIYNQYYDMLKESVYAESWDYSFLNNDSEFDSAVETLKSHVSSRNTAVQNYLNK